MNEYTKSEVTPAEDASDIEAFESRETEPDYAFEDVVEDLKRRGKI